MLDSFGSMVCGPIWIAWMSGGLAGGCRALAAGADYIGAFDKRARCDLPRRIDPLTGRIFHYPDEDYLSGDRSYF